MAYVSKLDQAELAESVDDLSADLVGNVQLHHTHIRGAERSIFGWSHLNEANSPGLHNVQR